MGEHREGNWLVSRWTGEIDGDNAEQLEERTLGELRGSDAGLTIDLSGVSYLDSAGIRVLTSLH
ncbi:MAG: STAS domain-containing protein, partial [Actinomycetota bacterium]